MFHSLMVMLISLTSDWSLAKKYMNTIFINNLPNRSNERKWFHTEKVKKQIISETFRDVGYTDDLVLKSLLHILEQVTRSIDLYINSDRTVYLF